MNNQPIILRWNILNAKVTVIEAKKPNTSGLVKETDFNTKNTETGNKLPDTADFIKTTNFETKLNKVTLNKTKQIEAGKKQNDLITSCTKLINKVTREVLLVSTKKQFFIKYASL